MNDIPKDLLSLKGISCLAWNSEFTRNYYYKNKNVHCQKKIGIFISMKQIVNLILVLGNYYIH
jgi:hypothetical protein